MTERLRGVAGPRGTLPRVNRISDERLIQEFVRYCRADTVKDAAHALGLTEQALKSHLTILYAQHGVTCSRQLAWQLWGPR